MIEAKFAGPVSSVTLDAFAGIDVESNSSGESASVSAFDSAGRLIATRKTVGYMGWETLTINASDIRSLQFSATADYGGAIVPQFDNLRVTMADTGLILAGTDQADYIVLQSKFNAPTSYEVIVNGQLRATGLWANVQWIALYGGRGADTIDLKAVAAGVAVTANGGDDGDVFLLQEASVGARITLNGDRGNDVFRYTPSDRRLARVAAPVTVHGGTDTDTLELWDNNNTANSVYNVTATALYASPMPTVTYATLERLNLYAGAGSDSINVSGGLTGQLNGGGGVNSLGGPNQSNTWRITGPGSGSLNAFAYSGIHNLYGGASEDSFYLAAGQGVPGFINGRGGVDTLDYSAYTTPVSVNLALGTATGVTGGISGIRNVTGGSGADRLIGNSYRNVLLGLGGSDVLQGGEDNDYLDGGTGYDELTGGGGTDTFVQYSIRYLFREYDYDLEQWVQWWEYDVEDTISDWASGDVEILRLRR